MNAGRYVKLLWLEEIYSVFNVIYLFRLNALNKELLSQNFDSALQLLLYEGRKPIYFFVYALVLFGAGMVIICRRGNKICHDELEYKEILISVLGLILMIIQMIGIVVLIDNPILRAVMMVCATAVAALYSYAD